MNYLCIDVKQTNNEIRANKRPNILHLILLKFCCKVNFKKKKMKQSSNHYNSNNIKTMQTNCLHFITQKFSQNFLNQILGNICLNNYLLVEQMVT